MEPTASGDPQSPLRWTSKSVRMLASHLKDGGHSVSYQSVSELLADAGYSLQANRKTREGTNHPDRDEQFRYINRLVREFQRDGQPVVSVDTKKKELVGDFKNTGKQWRPKQTPDLVRVHDFLIPEKGKAIPYGVYDLTRNAGWVSVGIDHDTASFAARTILRWWRKMGQPVYPQRATVAGHCGRWGQQRAAGPVVEMGGSAAGRPHWHVDHGVSLPPGNQQVEQDRAPPVLLHQHELARSAADKLGGHCQPDSINPYCGTVCAYGPNSTSAATPMGRKSPRNSCHDQAAASPFSWRLELHHPSAPQAS